MSSPSDEHPLNLDEPALIRTLRDVLRREGYTTEGIVETLGQGDNVPLERLDPPVYLRRLANEPRHSLIKLFFLGTPVQRDDLVSALAPLTPDDLVHLGLIQARDDAFICPYRLRIYDNLYFICDRAPDSGPLRRDHVTGVNNSSTTLAALTVRRGGRALDMGTGSGVQALLMARHCESVVATDINRRALNMTAFNIIVNGATNVECRAGSLFEPVVGEQFDLLVCNPPYVISPRADYQFRDGGLRGDEFSRLVVEQAPRYLRLGGFATILCDWVHDPAEAWDAPLRAWLRTSDCDALLLRHHQEAPLDYAAAWMRQPEPPDVATYDRQLGEWLAYYEALGIQAISGGAVILRRSAGPHWVRAEELPAARVGEAGEHLRRMFEAQDYLVSLPDARAFLAARLVPTENRVRQSLIYREGGYEVEEMWVQPTHGIIFEGRLDSF
ncbi:MAG: methyltransferase, partial [Anaerolineae bacterium]|nr:methyltransferase [Anaerolineae bacterium]